MYPVCFTMHNISRSVFSNNKDRQTYAYRSSIASMSTLSVQQSTNHYLRLGSDRIIFTFDMCAVETVLHSWKSLTRHDTWHATWLICHCAVRIFVSEAQSLRRLKQNSHILDDLKIAATLTIYTLFDSCAQVIIQKSLTRSINYLRKFEGSRYNLRSKFPS